MVFSSMIFLFAFLPAVLLIYNILPRNARLLFLLLANLFFYGWGEPVFVLVMILVTVINYVCGLVIGKTREASPGKAKAAVLVSAILSIGILSWFKYAAMFTELFNSIPFLPDLTVPKVVLPIGISFYTFQTMSYCIDVYRGDSEYQSSLVKFGVYVTLFPQLIAGPIVRYKDVAEQLDGHRAPASQFADGIRLFVIGLGKKVLLANSMGLLWDTLRPNAATNGIVAAWVGIIAYTLQIYFDFSGYSDMACGLGGMLGLKFLQNFNYPYISSSITEFWRRWHISLSTWFRDYVYIPLGGNRKGGTRTCLNLLAVWFLTGLWHGASVNFILWGLYYFVMLMLEKFFLKRWLDKLPSVLRHLYALLVIVFGWALFYFDSSAFACLDYIKLMFSAGNGCISVNALNTVVRYLPLMLIACLAATPAGSIVWGKIRNKKIGSVLEPVLVIGCLLLCVAALVNSSYNPFLYFKF